MVRNRTGKFERWILLNTYLKTIERQLPEKWDTPRWIDNTEGETYWKHLFKSEVLRNFFKLEYSERKLTGFSEDKTADYFKGRGYWGDFTRRVDAQRSEARRNRALATYSRTKNHMVKKGLIKTKLGEGPNTEGIALTAKGQKKAKKIYMNNN